jgi:HD-like signal output (HDOD) protein
MPAVRSVVREAAASDGRLSAFVLAIVKSPAFRMKADTAASTEVAAR